MGAIDEGDDVVAASVVVAAVAGGDSGRDIEGDEQPTDADALPGPRSLDAAMEEEAAEEAEVQPEPESVVTPTLMQDFKTAYRSQPTEFEYWAEPSMVEGVIPAEMEGTFFRNGESPPAERVVGLCGSPWVA